MQIFYLNRKIWSIIEFLVEEKKNNLKITIIGAGSNTLFRDNGVKGAVIKLGKEFSNIKLIGKIF